VDGSKLILTYTSPDGEEGYPGTLSLTVVYELNEDNELYIEYTAMSDKPTIINLTNHSYFNLAGHKSTTIGDHLLSVNSDQYLEKTEHGVPNGVVASVDGKPFDLHMPVILGDRIPKITGPKLGFDHNFCLKPGFDKGLAAVLEHPSSGRCLEVYTNQPGVQIYTGNFLNGIPGKQGAVYDQHSSIALETQNYPDAIHHDNFPNCILRPGDVYNHKTWYKFNVAL
jgi:aldose 1-epimerase